MLCKRDTGVAGNGGSARTRSQTVRFRSAQPVVTSPHSSSTREDRAGNILSSSLCSHHRTLEVGSAFDRLAAELSRYKDHQGAGGP